jgi:hypothetical protein
MGHFGIYTNCQGKAIYEEFLSKMTYFSGWTFTFLENYSIIKDRRELNKNIIGDFDIFLFQPVDIKHGVYSTLSDKGILSLLKPSCLPVSFPSVYADIWPIYEENGGYYGGEAILKLKDQGKTIEDILKLFDTKMIDFQLKERSNVSLEYMQIREQSCTIKSISSYIKDNIQKTRLFYTQNHPTEDFIAFIAGEICNYIELSLGIQLRDEIEYGSSFIMDHGVIEDSIYSFTELGLEYMSGHYEEDTLKTFIQEIYTNPRCLWIRTIYLANPSTL